MRYEWVFDEVLQKHVKVGHVPSPFYDEEWQWLLHESPERLCELVLHSQDWYTYHGAAQVIFSQYPDHPQTLALLWDLRKEPSKYWLIQSCQNPPALPVLEKIAFGGDPETLPQAIGCALFCLSVLNFNFAPYRPQLQQLLGGEDSLLRVYAATALAMCGDREGVAVLAQSVQDAENGILGIYAIEQAYLGRGCAEQPYPPSIEQALLECAQSRATLSTLGAQYRVIHALEVLLCKPLRPETKRRLRQLLTAWKGQAEYAGVLRRIEAFLREETPLPGVGKELLRHKRRRKVRRVKRSRRADAKRFVSIRTPHPSNKDLQALFGERQ